jgi:hypothetical protein
MVDCGHGRPKSSPEIGLAAVLGHDRSLERGVHGERGARRVRLGPHQGAGGGVVTGRRW